MSRIALTPQTRRPIVGLRLLVVAVVLLNLLDAVFTLVWVEAGIAEEANMLLEGILSRSTVGFVSVKMGLVSLGVLLLWRRRGHRLALVGLALSLLAYTALLVYHFGIAAVTYEFA